MQYNTTTHLTPVAYNVVLTNKPRKRVYVYPSEASREFDKLHRCCNDATEIVNELLTNCDEGVKIYCKSKGFTKSLQFVHNAFTILWYNNGITVNYPFDKQEEENESIYH